LNIGYFIHNIYPVKTYTIHCIHSYFYRTNLCLFKFW